jgi:RNA polymerase sigma factor (sigma-70 family)
MPIDPLTQPIAVLTDHTLLTPAAEAALIATIRAGIAAQSTLHATAPPAHAEALRLVAHGAAARATLARHNLRLVVALARRFQHMAGDHLTLDDLISFGTIGLLQGIDRFDPEKAGKLSTYVTWWIRQAITRGIMEQGRLIALPVHLHERRAAQRRVAAQLTQQLGRTPISAELDTALGWSRAKLVSVAADLSDADSLNVRIGDDADSSERGALIPDTRSDPEREALERTVHADMQATLARLLTAREQQFVSAHFGFKTGEKVTLDMIGQRAGLTRERVRQVIVGALAKLRADPAIQAYAAVWFADQ